MIVRPAVLVDSPKAIDNATATPASAPHPNRTLRSPRMIGNSSFHAESSNGWRLSGDGGNAAASAAAAGQPGRTLVSLFRVDGSYASMFTHSPIDRPERATAPAL